VPTTLAAFPRWESHDQYCFVPLAVETLGALGEEAAIFSETLVAALLGNYAHI